MKKLVLVAATLAASLPALADVEPDLAQPATLRQAMMAQVGKSFGYLGAMAKGEAPFDARLAESALRTAHTAAMGFAGQFPAGTETGYDTEASPAIWDKADAFLAANAKFVADTGAALKAPPADVAALGETMKLVGGNCKSCHEAFRVKKD